jgi:hypothetical protein
MAVFLAMILLLYVVDKRPVFIWHNYLLADTTDKINVSG